MKSLIVVDDFYSQPDKIRTAACDCEWLKPEALGPKFPGIESRRSFYSTSVVNEFEALANCRIRVETTTLPFGVFSLGLEQHLRHRVVHVDPCEWTGIVYLTLPEHCKGGTALYRHVSTGLTKTPDREQLEALGYRSEEEFNSKVFEPDQVREEAWREDIVVGMKYNRLILFRANSFHASTGYFGKTIQDARLIQLFFFNPEPE
jgi:hypothetical protein